MSIEHLTAQWAELYRSYGYQNYAMSKFEEYELYLRNKDFLISDRVLTFTDTDGKLMALKPDVTLSIIKNTADSGIIQKICYQEHVYRPGKSEQGFREIPQVGLECMGKLDNYSIFEVMLLAVKSLQIISDRCVLDVSHMGLLARLLDNCGLSGQLRQQVLEAIGSKNAHSIRELCAQAGIDSALLETVAQLSGKPVQVLPALTELMPNAPELAQLQQLLQAMEQAGVDCINVDFSVINDMNYYNGIVFRGFVEGVPAGVLSGGQYDGLMQKMKRSAGAIGFALYPDLLERMYVQQIQKDVDAVLLYETGADLCALAQAVEKLTKQGLRICALPGGQKRLPCAMVYRFDGNEVKCVEADA